MWAFYKFFFLIENDVSQVCYSSGIKEDTDIVCARAYVWYGYFSCWEIDYEEMEDESCLGVDVRKEDQTSRIWSERIGMIELRRESVLVQGRQRILRSRKEEEERNNKGKEGRQRLTTEIQIFKKYL